MNVSHVVDNAICRIPPPKNAAEHSESEGAYSMLAMTYRGPQRVRIDQKPIPEIQHPQDAVVRVTRSCICGSDLHLYNGSVPDTRVGMTFGHEVTGVVEEGGPGGGKRRGGAGGAGAPGGGRPGGRETEGRRPRAGALQHRLREVRLLSAGALRELPRIQLA